jgi:hypothetical protein
LRKVIGLVLVLGLALYLWQNPQVIRDTLDKLGANVGTGSGSASNGDPCGGSSGTTTDLLPHLASTKYRSTVNPCIPFVDAITQVTDLIPAADREKTTDFLDTAKSIGDRLAAVNNATKCAYRTDRLSIGIYQNQSRLWSVGVVAVVRGDIDAVASVALCYLIDQIRCRRAAAHRTTRACATTSRRTR